MQQYFFVRIDSRYVKINFQDILYVEASRNYIKLVTETRKYLVLFSMKKIEQVLPLYFKRIHKSFIVSLDKITGFDSERVYLESKELPIGPQYKQGLEKGILIANEMTSEPVLRSSFYSVPLGLKNNSRKAFFEAG